MMICPTCGERAYEETYGLHVTAATCPQGHRWTQSSCVDGHNWLVVEDGEGRPTSVVCRRCGVSHRVES